MRTSASQFKETFWFQITLSWPTWKIHQNACQKIYMHLISILQNLVCPERHFSKLGNFVTLSGVHLKNKTINNLALIAGDARPEKGQKSTDGAVQDKWCQYLRFINIAQHVLASREKFTERTGSLSTPATFAATLPTIITDRLFLFVTVWVSICLQLAIIPSLTSEGNKY